MTETNSAFEKEKDEYTDYIELKRFIFQLLLELIKNIDH